MFFWKSKLFDDRPFYFGIPLRAKARSKNWRLICSNLERTLSVLARQKCQDFAVLIACHERPDINTFGLNVAFVAADFPLPDVMNDKCEPGNDKPLKKRLLGMALRECVSCPFYYMQLDADDLIHPELVKSTLLDANGKGYLIDKGYIFDCLSGQFAACDNHRSPFWQQCGSCAVVYFTPSQLPHKLMDNKCYFTQFKRHREYAAVAASYGRALVPFEDYMAVYIVNHGENDVTLYRGKADVKSKYINRYIVKDASALKRLYSNYPELIGLLKYSHCKQKNILL